MKKLTIIDAEYSGETESYEFITAFQKQAIIALKKRGILTESACDKGMSILKGKGK